MSQSKYYFSWSLFDQFIDSFKNEMIIDNYKPDLIIGLARGGLPAAVALSHRIGVPVLTMAITTRHDQATSIDASDFDRVYGMTRGKRILIVDDIFDSGRTVNSVINMLDSQNIKALALVRNPDITIDCPTYDGFLNQSREWIVFPWEQTNDPTQID